MANYFGYMRISTKEAEDKQSFTRQYAALDKYAKENNVEFVRIFKDDITGTTFARKEYQILKKALHKGDTIIFKEISRFTRQAEAGLKEYMELLESGINLVFLDNSTVSTDYIKQLGAVAESQDLIIRTSIRNVIELLLIVELDRVQKEREIIVKRIRDGIEASGKKQGRQEGKLDKMSEELKIDIKRFLADRSIKQNDLIKKHDISRNTLKKYVEIVKTQN